MILGFADYEEQGRRLAEALDRPFELVGIHRFPDGESKVTLPPALPGDTVLCRSLDQPNGKLVELLLAARTARELGASRLTLVAPYLCYMRQDIAFAPGEAVSQKIIGRFLADLFDGVLTVDPHLHRTPRLEDVIPARYARAISCAPAMAAFLKTRFGGRARQALLLGPDGESVQWVEAIARAAGLEYRVAEKERLGDHEVRTALPEGEYRGREVIIVDDMASTGRTIVAVAEQLRAAGAETVHCLVTHALFAKGSTRILGEAGVEGIWSSDSIAHPTNEVSLAELLAEAVREIS